MSTDGTVEVTGVIEDARISAQGNLLVRGGILQGSQRVKAIGDIDARYVTNREIKCHTLRISSSLRWSRVLATGDLIAKEILGGDLIVAGNITVDQLGSADGLATRVQVGTNPFEERQFITAREQHERLVEAVHSNKERCKLIAHRVQLDPTVGAELRTALADFSAACAALATCEALLERHSERQQQRARQQVAAFRRAVEPWQDRIQCLVVFAGEQRRLAPEQLVQQHCRHDFRFSGARRSRHN